ncbi:MAG: putative ribonuclease H [Prokaryotic dsDNA virus sp.]|nr:MAG: putative ribonuclease H [Prokaryotic dsDNA virus sp.]|tara:strand:- start:29176 stop:29871 length:696 start_codon:yes stop_codon:yes gene_type:complete
MIVLFDADSLLWSSCINVEDDLVEAKGKFDEVFMSIVNIIDDYYPVEQVIVFAGARGNFRKKIYKKYKLNRKNKKLPKQLPNLQEYLNNHWSCKNACGMETDDLISIYWHKLKKEHGRDNLIIVSLDKDYKQLPALIYNYHYKHKEIYDITPGEALKNFYTQMVVGDSTDNVNFCKGYGKKYAEKIFSGCKTKYQYIKRTFMLYKKIYKQKAREKYIQSYKLLKLLNNEAI